MSKLLNYLYPTRPNKNGNNLLLREMKKYVNEHHNNKGEIVAVKKEYNQPRKKIIRLIESNKYDINLQNNDGYTALMYASKILTFQEIVKLLIEKGANLNSQNNNDETALIIASDYYHLDIVKILVEKGAGLNIKNNIGNTALIYAVNNGYLDIVNLLVEKGANLDSQNNDGNTALIIASINGYLDIVKILVEKGANINIQNNIRNTALIYVLEKIKIIQERKQKLRFSGNSIYGTILKKYEDIRDYLMLKSNTKPKDGGGKKISLKNYTIIDLKSICRTKKLKNYSNLNKDDLIKLLKKNK